MVVAAMSAPANIVEGREDLQILPRPPSSHQRYVCKMPPALLNDYIVTMGPDNPQQAALHILAFYTPGGWGKGGIATIMKRPAVKPSGPNKALHFIGEDISFRVQDNIGQLKYYGTEFPCPLQQLLEQDKPKHKGE